MSEAEVPAKIVARLRNNLNSAGIKYTEQDIQGMVEKGFLKTATIFEELEGQTPVDLVPDYLKEWSEAGAPLPAPSPVGGQGQAAKPGGGKTLNLPARQTSIEEIAGRIKSREVSPLELTRQALTKIAERDPVLNAFQLVLASRALEAAQQAEAEIKSGNYRGPLHGVPVAVKDLLAMEGTTTTAGSKILADWVPTFNATAVNRLEEAGAVIVGKTRMSEFAYAPGSINAHYGPTHNPRNLDFDTGGSSSGSGAAVADGLVFGALGTDTGGSIRIPSALCGIVGLKPTFGRTSLFGGVTLSWSLDHIGPMVNTVEDAAIMLEVLAGYDPGDPRTRHAGGRGTQKWAGKAGSARGIRIGVPETRHLPPLEEAGLHSWKAGLELLEENGAHLVELGLPDFQAAWYLNSAILAMEAAAYHEPNLRTRLDDFGPFMRHRVLSAYTFSYNAFIHAQQARINLRQRMDSIWEKVDLLSTPSMPGPATPFGVPASTALSGPFNLLGWPAITVPVGMTGEGLPLGLQLVGKPWDEALVLQVAKVLENPA